MYCMYSALVSEDFVTTSVLSSPKSASTSIEVKGDPEVKEIPT